MVQDFSFDNNAGKISVLSCCCYWLRIMTKVLNLPKIGTGQSSNQSARKEAKIISPNPPLRSLSVDPFILPVCFNLKWPYPKIFKLSTVLTSFSSLQLCRRAEWFCFQFTNKNSFPSQFIQPCLLSIIYCTFTCRGGLGLYCKPKH